MPRRSLLAVLCVARAADIAWVDDALSVAFGTRTATSATLVNSASRTVLRSGGGGHFRLNLLGHETRCLEYAASEGAVLDALLELGTGASATTLGWDGINRTSVQRFGHGDAASSWGYSFVVTFHGRDAAVADAANTIDVVSGWCERPVTTGLWESADNWSPASVPGEGDTVTIGWDAGRVVLGEDHTIDGLTMYGGSLLTASSSCPNGWSARPTHRPRVYSHWDAPHHDPATECFRAFDGGLSWADAEAACHASDTSQKGHLVMIESFEENEFVKQLCRGANASSACWIGLTSAGAAGREPGAWRWVDEHLIARAHGSLGARRVRGFAAWARGQPDNASDVSGGEHCAQMLAPSVDPELQAQGRWNDAPCGLALPFVCQSHGETRAHRLEVTGAFTWNNGYVAGAGALWVHGATTVTVPTNITGEDATDGRARGLGLLDSVEMRTTATMEITEAELGGSHAARLVNEGTLTLAGADSRLAPCSSGACVLTNNVSSSIVVSAGVAFDAGWHVQNFGSLELEPAASLRLTHGGDLAQGELLVDVNAELAFVGDSVSMTQIEMYELRVLADFQIVGELANWTSAVVDEYGAVPAPAPRGTFRLRVTDLDGARAETTTCIPYAASADELSDVLNALAAVRALGGVTVARAGDGSAQWNHGYAWTIGYEKSAEWVLPASRRQTLIRVECQGGANSCGCAEVLSNADQNAIRAGFFPACAQAQASGLIDPSRCTTTPTATASRLHAAAQADVTGGGRLRFASGLHWLPRALPLSLTVDGGAVVSMNKNFTADTLVVNGGIALLAGEGLEGYRVARALYAPPSADYRAELVAPHVDATVRVLNVTSGALRVGASSHESLVEVRTLGWSGGNVSGVATLRVRRLMLFDGAATKYAQSGVRLLCPGANAEDPDGGLVRWSAGDVSFSEGAALFNHGLMEIDAVDASFGVLSGDGPPYDTWLPGRDWDEGWYVNPLCGVHCDRPPWLYNARAAAIDARDLSAGTLALNVHSFGNLSVAPRARLVLSGGGQSEGRADVMKHGVLELAGGMFAMDGDSFVHGNGTIVVSGGLHSLPDIVRPNVEIEGGTVEVNSRELALLGDVTIRNGTLRFRMTSTNAVIANATLTIDGGELLFPEVLPNAGMHPAHLHTEVRNADRAQFRVLGPFVWRGGTIRGNVDLESRLSTHLDGGPKHLEALAHVINFENMLWGTGDVITKELGVLTTKGTMQMESPSTFNARLVYLDTFDGCCPEKGGSHLHTWEDNELFAPQFRRALNALPEARRYSKDAAQTSVPGYTPMKWQVNDR